MSEVWGELGMRSLGTQSRRLAIRLGNGLHRAVEVGAAAPRWEPFIPVRLLDHVKPYRSLTASRNGSYWNLVAPYATALAVIAPHSPTAQAIFEHMLRHGSRSSASSGPARTAVRRAPVPDIRLGSGLRPERRPFPRRQRRVRPARAEPLRAARRRDDTRHLRLGESASIAPLRGSHSLYRTMYLPPNGASNAAFLETLRLMLVHETTARDGTPRGLELAFATPRAWLAPGQEIAVRGMATSFGRVSFTIAPTIDSVHVDLDVPDRAPLRTLRLRLRLPGGERISDVTMDDVPLEQFDSRTGTIELPPAAGTHELEVDLG